MNKRKRTVDSSVRFFCGVNRAYLRTSELHGENTAHRRERNSPAGCYYVSDANIAGGKLTVPRVFVILLCGTHTVPAFVFVNEYSEQRSDTES